jgi:hypothetical protein
MCMEREIDTIEGYEARGDNDFIYDGMLLS